MSHEDLKDELSAFLDGELDTAAREKVQSHLLECGDCRSALEALKKASSALRARGRAKAPPGLKSAILRPPARARERLVFALTCAAVLLGLALAMGKAFKPQVSGVFNQIMGMISGAASTVGSDSH